MSIKLGNTDVNKIYLGSIESNKAYLGSSLVYNKSLEYYLSFDSTYEDQVDMGDLSSEFVGKDEYSYSITFEETPNFPSSNGVFNSSITTGATGIMFALGRILVFHESIGGITTWEIRADYDPINEIKTVSVTYSFGTLKLFFDGNEVATKSGLSNIASINSNFYLAKYGGVYTTYTVDSLQVNEKQVPINEGAGNAINSTPSGISGIIMTTNPQGIDYINQTMWKGGTPPPPPIDGNIYLMIGQSNMLGAESVANADPQYTGVIPNSRIWNSAVNQWESLEAGTNQATGNGYGLIFSLAYELNQHDPNSINYFVFLAQGGTSVADDWGVGLSLYNQALSIFSDAYLTGNYNKKAICWQQGERDSKELTKANNYESDEGAMIDGMLAATGMANFIDGKIGNITVGGYDYVSTINTAKDNNLTAGKSTATIDTSDLALFDGLHYSAASYETLGGTRYFDLVKNL